MTGQEYCGHLKEVEGGEGKKEGKELDIFSFFFFFLLSHLVACHTCCTDNLPAETDKHTDESLRFLDIFITSPLLLQSCALTRSRHS